MGWTFYHQSDVVSDPQAEIDSLLSWDGSDGSGQVKASAIVGATYFAAVEIYKPASGARYTIAFVVLFERRPFGYKIMDETMGPCRYRCPRKILEKLSPLDKIPGGTAWAAEWRAKAWNNLGGQPMGQQMELI